MAIEFARMEIVSRSAGGSACRKGAYNAREIVKDQLAQSRKNEANGLKVNLSNSSIQSKDSNSRNSNDQFIESNDKIIDLASLRKGAYNARSEIKDIGGKSIYNFKHKEDNVFHEILIPDYVDRKFLKCDELMNEVERREGRVNSQLLYEYVIALPDDKEIDLEDRKELVHRFAIKKNWVQEGLGVQLDIHKPHKGDHNWHAHILVTTRRFKEDGTGLGAKARDLKPVVRRGYVFDEEKSIGKLWRDIQNEYFKERGLDIKVDDISPIPGLHVGPRRMRGIKSKDYISENLRREQGSLEIIHNEDELIKFISKYYSMFSVSDIRRVLNKHSNMGYKEKELLIDNVLNNKNVEILYEDRILSGSIDDLEISKFYTTQDVRRHDKSIDRLSSIILERGSNNHKRLGSLGLKEVFEKIYKL